MQHELHSGVILPIGSEPSGSSWTGFQSIVSPTEGFLLVYREATPEAACELPTRLPEGASVSLTAVLGSGTDASLTAGPDGRLPLSLPQPNSFALYRYKIL